MDFSGISRTASPDTADTRLKAEDARLKQVCGDIEGLFISILMKEGLRPMIEGEEDNDSASKAAPMLEATVEQTARAMADQGGFGIAQLLYADLSRATAVKQPEKTHE